MKDVVSAATPQLRFLTGEVRERVLLGAGMAYRYWTDGYDFILAGWHKFTTPAWMDGSGTGILGYWKGALGTTASGAPVITTEPCARRR